jgi:hypothetical protein
MNIRNQLILYKNNKNIIMKMIETLCYYQNTTHPNIATLWINYINNDNINNDNINKLVKEYNTIIEKMQKYPDLSVNQILLIITFMQK